MNCVIVDDNKMARASLRQILKNIEFINIAGECDSVIQALNILQAENIDLVLLDVEMPSLTGFDFLKSVPVRPLVILVTANPDYAVEAFEYNVVDFIVKPVKEDRLIKAVMRANDIFKSRKSTHEIHKEYFFIYEKGVSAKLLLSDILFVQALGDYITIHTREKRFTIHYTLSAIEKELPASKFMRVHRSYIVALDKIDIIEKNTAFLNKTPVPIGDTQRSELLRRINLL